MDDQDRRPAEPRTIDADDDDAVRAAAGEMKVRPDLVREAVAAVGCNRTAVELYLTAPRA